MQRKRKTDTRRLTITAMMIALSVVFERLLPLIDAPEMRLSLGNVPIFLTSIAVSPVYGAVCGFAADFVGCLIKGYAPNPFLMLAPVLTGILPYYALRLLSGVLHKDMPHPLSIALTVAFTNIISGALVTTLGLSLLYGNPFLVVLVPRLATITLGIAVDAACLYLILKSGVLSRILKNERNGKIEH